MGYFLSNRNGTGLAFHTYKMPRSGKFVSSWYHSHPQCPSEMWVLDANYADVVPKHVRRKCLTSGVCAFSHGQSYGTTVDHTIESRGTKFRSDIGLEPLGTSAAEIK